MLEELVLLMKVAEQRAREFHEGRVRCGWERRLTQRRQLQIDVAIEFTFHNKASARFFQLSNRRED